MQARRSARRAGGSALLGCHADEGDLRVEREGRIDITHDRDSGLLLPGANRVEDRHDVLTAIAQQPVHRLPVMPVGGEALGEDQRALTRSQGRAPRRNLHAVAELRPGRGIVGEQQVAVEVDVVAERRHGAARGDAQPRLDHAAEHHAEPERPRRAAIRNASRTPPDFASLMLIPCATSRQAATSDSVWQSSST